MLAVLTALILVQTDLPPGQAFEFPGFNFQSSLTSCPETSSFYASFGLRKYINSFTSYQFPDPEQPQLDPLSRLEWPWEQTAGVVKLGYVMNGLEVKFDFASTLIVPSFLKAQDSDWEDPNNPGQKTTFSDAKAKPRLWAFDGGVAFDIRPMPVLKAVVGYRAQQFTFTYTDMLQGTIWDNSTQTYRPVAVFDYVSGPAIEFSQYYQHWYGGGILTTSFDLEGIAQSLAPWQLVCKFQGDYAYVKANNSDFHVLRTPGPRFTAERTTGSSWHLNLTAEMRYSSRLGLSVEGDFMRIHTKGSHLWTEPGVNQSWDGAKVWSDQKYIAVSAIFAF
jgi:hypothetical protein